MFLSLALFGFLIGAGSWLIFDWMIINSLLPSVDVLLSPWFLSGVVGSFLAIVIVYVFARYSTT
jgi:hypothetical protein